jgi:hypothetical protein
MADVYHIIKVGMFFLLLQIVLFNLTNMNIPNLNLALEIKLQSYNSAYFITTVEYN